MTEATPGTWRIAGHEPVIDILRRSLHRPHHAYLFLGPKRVGKTAMAIELAKALNCTGDARPCNQCRNCKLIEHDSHTDVSVLVPNEKENVIIEQARQLRQDLALLPTEGQYRVVILPGDRLTEPAADALLKTLEEPPAHAVLILTGHDLDAIPETIVSRCRTLAFGLVEAPAIAAELVARGISQEAADKLSRLAYGAPGWAIEASEKEDMIAKREALRGDLARWSSRGLLDRMAAAEALSGGGGGKLERVRAAALEELEIMTRSWRDILVASAGAPGLASTFDDERELQSLASGETPETALDMLRAISVAATRIDENVDPRLALEALAVSSEFGSDTLRNRQPEP